jgi:hypothetical protein
MRLARLRIAEGWSDEEIYDELDRVLPTGLHLRNRRMAEAFIAEVRGPAKGWKDVDNWGRLDFLDHVKKDKRDGRSGSKRSVAERVHLSPTALFSRLAKVRKPGESWPSGQKGPRTG